MDQQISVSSSIESADKIENGEPTVPYVNSANLLFPKAQVENNNSTKPVNNFVNNSEQAEMSLSPTIIIPLRGSQNNSVRVRTLLDPGSGTNWIVKDLLDKVQFTKKGQENLEVVTFSGTVKKKFQLVEVYYLDESEIKQSLMCYVYEVYTRHITVKGMLQYIINNAQEQSVLFKNMKDPASSAVDHKNQGIGMILCSSSINRLRAKENIVHIPDLDILLEPTIFGVTVSGSIPACLRKHVEVVMANNIAPVLITDCKDPCLFMSQDSHDSVAQFLNSFLLLTIRLAQFVWAIF